MKRYLFSSVFLMLTVSLQAAVALDKPASSRSHDLRFTSLAKTWDEGKPLGNGVISVSEFVLRACLGFRVSYLGFTPLHLSYYKDG